jgi:gentisate 1,2-dioxygenase
LRFIIEGEGAHTTLDGRRYPMERGDLVLTPNWAWHEHGHEGGTPMIWLDGLDLPMIHSMHMVFAEFRGAPEGPPQDAGPDLVNGRLQPLWPEATRSRPVVYKLAEVEATFDALRDTPGDPYDDLLVEYRDPRTNQPVLPTMSAYMQLLRPGVQTQTHRHSQSAVYHVVRGAGSSTIGGATLTWGPGDTFALPTWAPHSHVNQGDEDALLFSFSDAAAQAALGLLRADADADA